MQAKYGDYDPSRHPADHLQNDRLLPQRFLSLPFSLFVLLAPPLARALLCFVEADSH